MLTLIDDTLILLCSVLSTLGTIYVIVNYLMDPVLQNSTFKYVYNLSVSNFIWSISTLSNLALAICLPDAVNTKLVCQGFATIKLFSHLSGLLWTATISQKLYQSTFKRQLNEYDEDQCVNFRKIYLICYVFPALVSIGIWVSGDYGHVYPFYQYNCFVGDDIAMPSQWLRSLIVRLVFYYVPIWVLFIYIIWITMKISIFLLGNLKNQTDKSYIFQLLLYPLLILVCWVPSSIKKMLSDFHIGHAYNISVLEYNLMCLYGFLNALVYSYQTLLKQKSLCQIIKSGCFCLCYQKLTNKNDPFHEMKEESIHDMKISQKMSQSQSSQKDIEIIGSAGIFKQVEFQNNLNSQVQFQAQKRSNVVLNFD